ncbi:MAG: M67 family metallopeptidase [Chloroflexi bacterium]|nr:M67 family metallopeptidase [Chloroflexota bacterium]
MNEEGNLAPLLPCPPAPLQLTAVQWDTIWAHLRAVAPQEGCGLLAGVGGRVTAVYPIPNKLASPMAFEMEPAAQVEAMLAMERQDWELLAIYHSHPTSPAYPSPTDIAYAVNYPETGLLIVSLLNNHAGFFWVRDGLVEEGEWLVASG